MENERLIEMLQLILEVQKEILEQLKHGQKNIPLPSKSDLNPLNDLIDSVDVKTILKISDSTLYRIKKSNKVLKVIPIGGRDYYSLTQIKEMVNYFMK